MKSVFTTLLVTSVAVLMLCFFPMRSYAQDTLEVPNQSGGQPVFLNNAILGDTLSNGQPVNPNRVYRLARGLVYYHNASIPLRRNVVILANATPAATKPPVIAPAILQNGQTAPAPLFQFFKNATLKNLYITRIRPDTVGSFLDYSQAIVLSADSTRLIVQGCVFDGWGGGMLEKDGVFNKIYISDCVIRNGFNGGGSWFGGNVFLSVASPGDTVVMVNNTEFNCGSYLFVPNRHITTYERVEHNTVFTTHVNPLYAPYLTNCVIRDNIFWGTLAMGQSQAEITGGWFDWSGAPSSTVSIDTLPTTMKTQYGITEASRGVVVTNNVYFWPQAFYDAWHNVYKDTLTPPVWMNTRTAGMFADAVNYPNLWDASNQNVDPGFNATMVNTLVPALLEYCRTNRGNTTGPRQHFYNPGGGSLFNVAWPLPENLAYSNVALQTAGHDGFPVGDLNWFPAAKAAWLLTDVNSNGNGALPEKFGLSQNYPNPFNPSTNIEFSLPRSAKVSLVVYDLLGRQVATLINGEIRGAGKHEVTFSAAGVATGIYFYRLTADTYTATMKMLVLK